jgi:hypothetical protein
MSRGTVLATIGAIIGMMAAAALSVPVSALRFLDGCGM